MHILILSWRDLKHPLSGGAELATHEHAKAWVEAGHSVTMFSAHFRKGKRSELVDGVEIRRRGYQYFGVQIAAFFWYLFGSHSKFDLVVDQFHGIPFFTPIYVRANILAYIHEVAKEVWELNPWPKPINLLPKYLGKYLEPYVFKIFYRQIPFMTVSESTKKDLIAWGLPEKNITVIHNGVTKPKLKKLPKKEKVKTITYLGAISKDKGIKDAVEVFRFLSKRGRNWKFWVIGKGDKNLKKKVEKKIRKFKMRKQVKFWGYVNEKKKFELLARTHLLINPSVREGWGLVNIEANSVGTPVVSYDVPGNRDSVKHGYSGFLTKKRTPRSMSNAVINILENKKLYKELGEGAVEWSTRFSWDKATKESLKLLGDVV